MIVLLGATGYVGNALVRQMARRAPDARFRVVGRNRTKLRALEQLPNVSSSAVWALGQPLSPLVENTDAVIDLSFSIRGIPSDVVRDARSHGDSLVSAADRAGTKQIILVSSIAVYGEPCIRHPWTEAPPPSKLRPNTIYGECKAKTEAGAVRANAKAGIPLTILRCGHVVGPGSAMVGNLASQLLCSNPTLLSGSIAPCNATSVNGIVETIANLLQRPPETGTRWGNHIDMGALTYDEIVSRIAGSLGIDAIESSYVPPSSQPAGNWVGPNLLGKLRSRQKQFLYLQSRLGRYDLGLSAGLLKAAKRKIGGSMSLLSAPPTEETKTLGNLYLSDPVPHTRDLFGPVADDETRSDVFSEIAGSLSAGGFRLPA